MNITVLIAGILAAFATIGHFIMGRKMYLKPMLAADFDPIAKRVMQSVFHYISAYLILSAFFLIMIGARGIHCLFDPYLLLAFLGGCYALMAIWQILIALIAKISLMKMFQWVFWAVIAVLIFMGIGVGPA